MEGADLQGSPSPDGKPPGEGRPSARLPKGRELEQRLRNLVLECTGIHLPEAKRLMVESRLRRRMISLGLPDLDAYLHHVFEEGGLESEREAIIDLMTTNKTDFFRERTHYDLLVDRILPEALNRSRGPVRFRFWSAAASTGAEAYTAAMLLAEAAREHPRLNWAILGTDISTSVLATARRAIYPAASLAPVPPELHTRYVMTRRAPLPAVGTGPGAAPHAAEGGVALAAGAAGMPSMASASGLVPDVRIVPELRRRVRFSRLNLMEAPYPVETGIDVIFLRNVLIYFDPPTQHRVISALVPHLRPGGYLVVGHSESMTVRQPALRTIAPAVFQKEGSP